MKNASHRANDTRRCTDVNSPVAHSSPSTIASKRLESVKRGSQLDKVPPDLRAERRWVTWRYESRRGKKTKRPAQAIDHSSAWLSFDDACALAARGQADGLGFVLGAGIVGIDLDACIANDDTLHEIARDAVALGTYAERSPGGRGLHLFIRAIISTPRKISQRSGIPGREIYDGRKGSARFFTVTGDRLGDASAIREGPPAQAALDAFVAKWLREEHGPSDVGNELGDDHEALDDNRLLQVMFRANDGAKWRRIFDGDYTAYPSQSEADLGLCRKLRFYTRANAAQIDRLFRRSNLMRSKWDERRGAQTYGESTIATAIASGGPLYRPPDSQYEREEATKRLRHERKAWGKFPLWWAVRLKGTGELAFRVLVVIASYANTKTGEAFPSIATIAAHCGVTERRVKSALNLLKGAGVLKSTPRARQSNLYQLAQSVPETITSYATRRKASRVTEPGHLGCSSHATITNQEPTTIDTGRGHEAA